MLPQGMGRKQIADKYEDSSLTLDVIDHNKLGETFGGYPM
jgi:hypothetical protein